MNHVHCEKCHKWRQEGWLWLLCCFLHPWFVGGVKLNWTHRTLVEQAFGHWPVHVFHGSHFSQRRQAEERRHGRHLGSAAPGLCGLGAVCALVTAACLGHFREAPVQLLLWFVICNEMEFHHERIPLFSPEKTLHQTHEIIFFTVHFCHPSNSKALIEFLLPRSENYFIKLNCNHGQDSALKLRLRDLFYSRSE